MEIRDNLKYTKEHEWVLINGNIATIGITDFAQDQLGDIVYAELPEVGQELAVGDESGSLESVKAVSELYCPIAGEVVEVNEGLDDAPETINESPYNDGWVFKIQIASNALDEAELMSAKEYRTFVEE